ncbi:MAG: hypothetical protein U0271_35685 [Polyangiaceae bacterium]
MALPKLRHVAIIVSSGMIVGLTAQPAPVQAARMDAGDQPKAHADDLETCDGDHDEHDDTLVPQKRGKFEALENVTLSNKVVEKLNAIAHEFSKKTGKTFVVTSGTRAAAEQAGLIYEKLEAGEDLLKLYKDKTAAGELIRAYESGRRGKKSKSEIVSDIAATIRAQMKRGVFISAHLKAGAADVRSSSMSATEKRAFMESVVGAGGVSLLMEATPPHFHLQLD